MNTSYQITIHTGDQVYAGTDSNIFIQLVGNKGISEEYRLNSLLGGNIFERNETDKFTLDIGMDCGEIYRINIRSDCMYAGSDWLLAWIEVKQDKSEAPLCRFSYNTWITDKAVKNLDVTSGLKIDDKVIQECYTRKNGEIITIPANSKSNLKCKFTAKTGIMLKETTISEIGTTTSTSVEASYTDPSGITAKGAINFALNTKNSKSTEQELKFEYSEEREMDISLESSPVERKFYVMCSYEKQEHNLTLGSLIYKIPVIDTVHFSGLEEIK